MYVEYIWHAPYTDSTYIGPMSQIIGLFCKRGLQKRRYAAKKTYLCMSHDWLYIHRTCCIHRCISTYIGPMSQITGLFCKRGLQKRRYSAKETYVCMSHIWVYIHRTCCIHRCMSHVWVMTHTSVCMSHVWVYIHHTCYIHRRTRNIVMWTVGVWDHTDSWLGAQMGSVLKPIQTLKEYF